MTGEADDATPGAEVPANVEDTATEQAAETTATKEETAEPEKAEAEETEKPKRPSGYERMKRRALIAEAQLANARLRDAGSKASDAGAKDDKAPREEDFNGDWGKYIAATAAYEAAKAVKGTLEQDKRSASETRVAELQSEVLADFEERKEEFKAKAKDFDDVVSSFVDKGGKFSDAVRDLVLDSDVGPQLTYHLAKNPAIANRLNSLPPLQAAKEIARIEDTLSKAPAKATKAPAPLTDVRGGAVAAFDPAKASMEEYVAKRKAGWKG